MKKILITLFTWLFFRPMSLLAASADSIPDHKAPRFVRMQYAGNMGFISIGFGKSVFSQKLSLSLGYGYVPKQVNEVEVHTISFKSAYNFGYQLKKKTFTSIYAGTTLLYSITKNTFAKLPGYYPNEYYPPNAFHFSFFTGLRVNHPIKNTFFRGWGFFAELGALDSQLWYAITSKAIPFEEALNLSFGMAFMLK